jgi:hypothetical protein
MSPRGARIVALVLAIALGQFLYLRVRESWTNYWLLKDAQKGIARVTKELWSGHNAVGYNYIVDGKEFVGRGARSWDDSKYRDVRVGQESVVYFSASHPWLSQLSMPRAIIAGAPVVLMVLGLEFFAVITIINPTSGWALGFVEKGKTN